MKSCPGCEFLIDDSESVCEFCAADPNYAARLKGFTTKTVVGALADSDIPVGGSVGLLERPVPSGVNWDETDVTSREKPGPSLLDSPPRAHTTYEALEVRRDRGPIPVKLIAIVVVLALGVVATASVLGHGPLAGEFARLGLTVVRSEVLPSTWVVAEDVTGEFTVEMPVGGELVFEPLDPKGVVPGGLAGTRVEGADGTYLLDASTDLGLGAAGLREMDSDEGLAELVNRFATARIPGKQTVSRAVLLPYGHANDSVYVAKGSAGSEIETRMRMILTGGQLQVLLTSGPASAARELDLAHQRMIGSFTVR